ncbi:MAG: ATP-binding protein [Polyangiaceae bacterium]|nr:ATP-binding protein [Polyangiaceae bacterium]
MRLTKVTIWNYRSFWSEDDNIPAADITLSPGVNYLVGPNNVGKSNLLRAIALALDPNAPFELALDRPSAKNWGPSIELELTAAPDPSPAIKKLLSYVEAYERKIDGFEEPSLASEGKVRLFVEYDNNGYRDERFLTRGSYKKGQVIGRNNPRQKAVEGFHHVIRFVDIKSGEDLQSLLQRGFKEILGSAMGAQLVKEMKAASEARKAYVDALGHVLRPVAKHVEDRIRRYVRGIDEVDLVANVPPVEDAIADAHVFIKDAVRTALEQKGTGVRGAMLLLLLSFIAETAKSAVVFGIEEPEAFLHPDAHRELGVGLESFTQRQDVTLLVTSHSPFIFRSDAGLGHSAVFVVRKDESGRSSVMKDVTAAARADLLGSQALSSLLEKAEEVPDSAKLILIVEGMTDQNYLELAAQKLGIGLDGFHILPRGSAAGAALQAVTMAARYSPDRLVVVLFDSDKPGMEGYDLLANRFSWKKKAGEGLYVLTYEKWLEGCGVPVEAEDLFANGTLDIFLAAPGSQDFCDEKMKRKKTGVWHYGLTTPGKIAFVQWLTQHGTAAMFEPWRPVLTHLRQLVADAAAKAGKKPAQ